MDKQGKEDYLFYLKDITKTFRNKKALKFCGEMTIKRGYFTFFTGESGIGKSTLLHILGLLDQADPGGKNSYLKYQSDQETVVNYFDLYKQDLKYKIVSKGLCARLRRFDFGFLPQDGHLLHSLSIRQNLEVIYNLRYRSDSKKANIQNELKAVMKRVDLDTEKIITEGNLSPAHLSGGETQRLALARAILYDPKVIFVDEPTTFMDNKLIKRSMELLFDLAQKGCSIIVVTHQYQNLYEILREQKKNIKIDNFYITKDSQNATTTFLKINNDSCQPDTPIAGVAISSHARNRPKKSAKKKL